MCTVYERNAIRIKSDYGDAFYGDEKEDIPFSVNRADYAGKIPDEDRWRGRDEYRFKKRALLKP